MNLNIKKKGTIVLWSGCICILSIIYLSVAGSYLYKNKVVSENSWNESLHLSEKLTQVEFEKVSQTTPIFVNTYIENINNIDIKGSKYSIIFQVSFIWDDSTEISSDKITDMEDMFTIYNGQITSLKRISDELTDENIRIQRFRVSATVNEIFDTTRFPLSSYQLRMYLIPNDTVEHMYWIPDRDNCGFNENLSVPGFEFSRMDSNVFYYRNSHNVGYEGRLIEGEESIYSELMIAVELNRDSWGLYLKCIIALLGTSIWAFLMLIACIYHKVDSLGMIPAVLFGTVSNILVGANLVPDAMQTGLLEFVNIWGIYTIIIISIVIMQICHIRNNKNNEYFAYVFGKCMIAVILLTTIAGHIVLPIMAFRF